MAEMLKRQPHPDISVRKGGYEGINYQAKEVYNLILGERKEKITDEKTFTKLRGFIGNVARYRGFNWPEESIRIEKVHGWNPVLEAFERAQTPDIVFETGKCDAERNILSIENIEGRRVNYAVNIDSNRWLTCQKNEVKPIIKYGVAIMDNLDDIIFDPLRKKELIPNEISHPAAETFMSMWDIDNYKISKLVMAPT